MVIFNITEVQRFLSKFYSFILKEFDQKILGKCQSQFNLFTCRRGWIRHTSDRFLQRWKQCLRNNHCHNVSFQIIRKDQYSMEKGFNRSHDNCVFDTSSHFFRWIRTIVLITFKLKRSVMTSFFRLLKLYRDKFRRGSEAVEQEKVLKCFHWALFWCHHLVGNLSWRKKKLRSWLQYLFTKKQHHG